MEFLCDENSQLGQSAPGGGCLKKQLPEMQSGSRRHRNGDDENTEARVKKSVRFSLPADLFQIPLSEHESSTASRPVSGRRAEVGRPKTALGNRYYGLSASSAYDGRPRVSMYAGRPRSRPMNSYACRDLDGKESAAESENLVMSPDLLRHGTDDQLRKLELSEAKVNTYRKVLAGLDNLSG